MTLELVPWRGANVPVLARDEVSRYNVAELLAQIQYSQQYMGAPMPVTTYASRPAEPISTSFEGFVWGMLYGDGPVAAVEAYRLRVFGQAPLLYQEMKDGRPGDLFDDDRLDRLRTPWPGGNLGDLMKRALVYGDFAGNAFVVDLEDELVLLRPDWVEIVLEKRMHRGAQVGWRQRGIVYYEGGLNVGDGVPFLPGEYCHFVPGLPDPLATFRGMSWLTPLVREVKADKSAGDHKVAFFENAASPNLAVSLPKEITPTQFKEFVDKMDSEHRGAAQAYKTLYTAGGADVTVIGANMQQMDFSAVQGKGETRIANAGGVSPALLSFSEGMQGSSLNAGNFVPVKRNFVDTTMRDLWTNWAGSIQKMDAFAPPDERKSRLSYDPRDIPFLRDDEQDIAQRQQTQASTISSLITAGYKPDSAQTFIVTDDPMTLEHTGLTSVQLMPPGSQDTDGDGVADAEAQAGEDYEAALDEFRSELAEWDEEISRAIEDGELDEIERRDYYDVRDFRGRFRKISDRVGHALNEWLKGDGDADDPLEEFSRENLRLAAKEFGITPRRGASSDELKLALLKDARARFRGDSDAGAKPSHRLTLSSPTYRDQDVGVYHDGGKVSLYRESSSGQRGSKVVTVASLAELEQWGRDHGEPQVAEWAASERGAAKPTKRAPAKKTVPVSMDVREFASDLVDPISDRRELDSVQEQIDAGKSLRQIGLDLARLADRVRTGAAITNAPRSYIDDPEFEAQKAASKAAGYARADRLQALAERLQTMRRPAKKATPPAPPAKAAPRKAAKSVTAKAMPEIPDEVIPETSPGERPGRVWAYHLQPGTPVLVDLAGDSVVPATKTRGASRATVLRTSADPDGPGIHVVIWDGEREHELVVPPTRAFVVSPKSAPAKATPKPKREPLSDPAAKLSSLRVLGDVEAVRDDLDLHTVAELKILAGEVGVATSGRKRDVVDRITTKIHTSASTPLSDKDIDTRSSRLRDAGTDEAAIRDLLADLDDPQLRQLAGAWLVDLPASGARADLERRLAVGIADYNRRQVPSNAAPTVPPRNPWNGPPSTRGGNRLDGADPAYEAAPDDARFDAPDSEVRKAVEEAWFAMTGGAPGAWASLEDVRTRIGDRYPFKQVNRVLRHLNRERDADLLPELYGGDVTDLERDARVNVGGKGYHEVGFDGEQAARIRREQQGVGSAQVRDPAVDAIVDQVKAAGGGEGRTARVTRLLLDAGLNGAQLRQVASRLRLDVPDSVKSKRFLQAFIANNAPDPEQSARDRQARLDTARTAAEALVDLDTMAHKGGSEKALRQRVDTRVRMGALTAEEGARLSAALGGGGSATSAWSTRDQRRQRVAQASTKPVTDTVSFGGFMGGTRQETHTDGTVLIHKELADDKNGGRSGVQQADAEELGSLVAAAVGLRAPAVHRTGPAELQIEHVAGTHIDHNPLAPWAQPPADLIDSDQGRLLGLLDVLTGNPDRHAGNWMLTDGGIAPVDNALSFGRHGSSGLTSPFTAYFANAAGNDWADNIDLSPADLATVRERLTGLRGDFERLDRLDWWQDMMDNLAIIESRASGTTMRVTRGNGGAGANPADFRTVVADILSSRGATTHHTIGDTVPFDPASMRAQGDRPDRGTPVQVVSPGASLTEPDGTVVTLAPTVVMDAGGAGPKGDREPDGDPSAVAQEDFEPVVAPRRVAKKAATIGEVALGPTQLQVALGLADVPSIFGRDFGDKPFVGAVHHRGEPLPAGFDSTRSDIYQGRFAQRPGLTMAESRALDLYVLSSVADPLNTSLRAGNPTHGTARTDVRAPDGGKLTVDLDEVAAELDSAIAASELPVDTNLYRGTMMRPADVGKLQPGAEFTEPGYLSTTTDQTSAYSIIHWRREKRSTRGRSPVLIHILAPAGTHAAVAHVAENELLLGRGRRMRVVSVLRPTRPGDTRRITVELLPEDVSDTSRSLTPTEEDEVSRAIEPEAAEWDELVRAAGHDTTLGNDELHHYWTRDPEGLAKWRSSPTPWSTLVAHLTKHVGPEKAKVFASKWFHEVFGYWSGSRKGKNPVGPG